MRHTLHCSIPMRTHKRSAAQTILLGQPEPVGQALQLSFSCNYRSPSARYQGLKCMQRAGKETSYRPGQEGRGGVSGAQVGEGGGEVQERGDSNGRRGRSGRRRGRRRGVRRRRRPREVPDRVYEGPRLHSEQPHSIRHASNGSKACMHGQGQHRRLSSEGWLMPIWPHQCQRKAVTVSLDCMQGNKEP